MLIPTRDIIAAIVMMVFFGGIAGFIVRMLIRRAYQDGYEAGKKAAHEISAPGRHPVYLR